MEIWLIAKLFSRLLNLSGVQSIRFDNRPFMDQNPKTKAIKQKKQKKQKNIFTNKIIQTAKK